MSEDARQTRFRKSLDVQVLEKRMRKSEVGDTINYSELTELIGADVTNGARSRLQSARRILERDCIVFATIPTVGIKRLSDSQVVATGPSFISKINRVAKRATRRMAAVQDFNALSNTDKILHNSIAAHSGALLAATTSKAREKVRRGVEENSGELLAAKRTLELLG